MTENKRDQLSSKSRSRTNDKSTKNTKKSDLVHKFISIYNPKGGCGKTMLAMSLAVYIAKVKKKKVLIIESDASCSELTCLAQELKNLKRCPRKIRVSSLTMEKMAQNGDFGLTITDKGNTLLRKFDYIIFDAPSGYDRDLIRYMVDSFSSCVIVPVLEPKYTQQSLDILSKSMSSTSKLLYVYNMFDIKLSKSSQSGARAYEQVLSDLEASGKKYIAPENSIAMLPKLNALVSKSGKTLFSYSVTRLSLSAIMNEVDSMCG